MCRNNPKPTTLPALSLALTLGLAPAVFAQRQNGPGAAPPEWRRIGNAVVDLSLASAASGPVDRVWYSADGGTLFAQTASRRVFQTRDFETWRPADERPPAGEPAAPQPGSMPAGATVRWLPLNPSRLYAIRDAVYRSDDGGKSWTNLTVAERQSIIGDGLKDLAVSPRSADEIVVADAAGVWRSLDGGMSWAGVNDGLPNLPVGRIVSLPQGSKGLRIVTPYAGVLEWAPGERQAWRVVDDPAPIQELRARVAASLAVNAPVTALGGAGDFAFAGAADGRIWYSSDRGGTWTESRKPLSGAVQNFFVDLKDGRFALAVLDQRAEESRGARVIRTLNAGATWDDITADLPAARASAITADRASGAVYVASDAGVFSAQLNLFAADTPSTWTRLPGIPDAPATDVRLDAEGNQLYVALQGYGIYAALAPHRSSALRLINAADFSQRPAAPGSLLTVVGGRVDSARAQGLTFPVLAASEAESQIQVPFEAAGNSLSLALRAGNVNQVFGLPLRQVSPAIFVDRDGSPLAINAENGLFLDANNPARANGRIQVLATGLGKVRPAWPTGMPAPLDNPPAVIAPVHVYLDGAQIEVTKAVLAPGYVGFYLIEAQLPAAVNRGASELYVEVEGQESNRIRIFIEP